MGPLAALPLDLSHPLLTNKGDAKNNIGIAVQSNTNQP